MNEKIFELIKRQFIEIMNNDYDFYKDYKIILSNEQQFVRERDRSANTIYIVVKFLPSSLNFGQLVVPITINAVAEQNKIEVCSKLLLEYAQTYNLSTSDDETIKQVYTSPSVASNFNDVFAGFRSLYFMSGTFLVSEKANPYKIYISGEEKPIATITNSINVQIQLDTKQFFDSDNFTRSVGTSGTFIFNFTTYLLDNDLVNKALAITLKDLEKQPDGINTIFTFDIVFKNGYKLKNAKFKLSNFSTQQNIGEIPVVSLTFTN